MTELDTLRVKRRNLQLELKKVEEKSRCLKEDLYRMDQRINSLANGSTTNSFVAISDLLDK